MNTLMPDRMRVVLQHPTTLEEYIPARAKVSLLKYFVMARFSLNSLDSWVLVIFDTRLLELPRMLKASHSTSARKPCCLEKTTKKAGTDQK